MTGTRIVLLAAAAAAAGAATGQGCAEQATAVCEGPACVLWCQIQGRPSGACSAGECACTSAADADADGDGDLDAVDGPGPADDSAGGDDGGPPDAEDVPDETSPDGGLAGTPGHIGGACARDSDCLDDGATCLLTLAGILNFTNGYCSIIGCPAPGPWSCPAGASCQCGDSGGCMCLVTCATNADCRSSERYICTSGYCLPSPF